VVAPLQILGRYELPVHSEGDVVSVRRKVRAIAQERGFDSFACAAVTTATSELCRNAWVHAGGGQAVIEEVTNGQSMGLRVVLSDNGPGIADVAQAMQGGFSTAKSMGFGLPGSKRLVDEFSIESLPGRGTVVTFVKWRPF
jgi:serine/threonine-protein kinase RsbT